MSKMDEMNKFIKEQENRPFNCMGERCVTKTQDICDKAQELGISWKTIICQSDNGVFNQKHIYAIINDKKIDVAYDPDTKKILKGLVNREEEGKYVENEYFSQKHTWFDVIYDLSCLIGENARVLDYSVDPKRIVFIDNEDFDREELESRASKFGVSCRFVKVSDGIISAYFTQTGKDNEKAIKREKRDVKMRKRWAIRDNKLRELEKE